MASTIKSGSAGPDVTTWQGLLTSAGFPVDATGTFDAATLAATKAWQAAKGLVADGIVGAASWAKMTGKVAVNPQYAKDADFGRQVLQNIWQDVTGESPNLSELQIAQAQAELESHYGKAQYTLRDHATGAVLASSGVINNWGAVQGGDPSAGTGFLASDTSPNKVTEDNPKGYYDHSYRKYATPEEGASSMLKEMTTRRPTSWALMKEGDIDAWAKQMWSYTDASHSKLNKDPETGVGGYFEQSPDQRALGIEMRIAAIADALNEPVAAVRGGPYIGPAAGGEGAGGEGGWAGPAASDIAEKGVVVAAVAAVAYGIWRIWFRKG